MPEISIPPARIRQEDQTFIHGIARSFATPDWPEEELVSVTGDALRMIRKIATQYNDPSCVELNQLELESEGRRKFIERLQKGVLDKIHDRPGLFKHLTTCWKNLARATVGKCRFTAKRMGVSAPPRGSKIEYNKSFKPEVSMEAAYEDETMNRAVQKAASIEDSKVLADFDVDMEVLLSPQEFIVYRQLTRPNNVALTLSEMEASRGHRTKRVLSVDITQANLALGLGIPLPYFETIVEQIRVKTRSYMKNNSGEQLYNTAVGALEKIFDVHVPRSAEPLVVRRIFTMKARADYTKVTPQVEDLLKSVGARPPVLDKSEVLNCYGILWQSNHPICRACDLYEPCRIEAANFGLESIALSPKLLPARAQVRTATREGMPYIVPGEVNEVDQVDRPKLNPSALASNSEEAQLLSFLEENFYGFYIFGERYYSYASSRGQQVGQIYLFRVMQKAGAMRVCFCEPTDKLKVELQSTSSTHYLPAEISFEEAIVLLEKHAQNRLSHQDKPKETKEKVKKKPEESPDKCNGLHRFIEDNFRGFDLRGERFYCPKKQVGRGMKYLFWSGQVDGQYRVRFCRPSETLTSLLDKAGKFHYLPIELKQSEAEKLIHQHAGTVRAPMLTVVQQLIKAAAEAGTKLLKKFSLPLAT
jgi:hypothetical protein